MSDGTPNEVLRSGDPLIPHIILCGNKTDRDLVRRELGGRGITLDEYDPSTRRPDQSKPEIPLYAFNQLAQTNLAALSSLTFSDIMGDSALYRFKSTASDKLSSADIQAEVNEIVNANPGLRISACLDKLISGPSEEPGISPGGTPCWLPGAPYPDDKAWWAVGLDRAALSPSTPKTAIFILDTAPSDDDELEADVTAEDKAQHPINENWQGKDVDLYADLTGLIVYDSGTPPPLNPAACTRATRAYRTKTLPHHGLIIAAMCRDLAPKGTIIVLLRVQNAYGEGSVYGLSCAFDYARRVCEKLSIERMIVNLSLGIRESTAVQVDSYHLLAAMTEALAPQTYPKEAFFVCAAGNSGNKAEIIKISTETGSITTGYERTKTEEPAAYADLEYTLDTDRKKRKVKERVDKHIGLDLFKTDTFAARVFNIGASDRSDYTNLDPILDPILATPDYAPFSNRADLVVPGTNLVMRCYKEGRDQYLIWSGTSFAAPQISAMIARLLNQAHSPDSINSQLQAGGIELGLAREEPSLNPFNDLIDTRVRHLNPTEALAAPASAGEDVAEDERMEGDA